MTAVIDTNSNHDPGNLVGGFQVVADPLDHSVSRQTSTKVGGFGFGVEYRRIANTQTVNFHNVRTPRIANSF